MFIKIGLVKALSFAFHSSAVLTFQLAYFGFTFSKHHYIE